MFIAYHVSDNHQDGIPVATGKTKQEAQALAITRILSRNFTDGSIAVQESKLGQSDFTSLRETLDKFFGQ